MELTSRPKMARFLTFRIQMRKNKPLDESRKVGQTSKYGWSEEDDKLLVSLHKQFGNKWADIARNMPGRCENSIKNHWNATKRNQFKISSNGYIKTKYHSYLLKDYITSISSSSSDNQINTQESSGFDPQNHESVTSLNAMSSSFPGSWVR
ncbi:putative transcription factor MYB-HB-like family [Helianthus anomalus]